MKLLKYDKIKEKLTCKISPSEFNTAHKDQGGGVAKRIYLLFSCLAALISLLTNWFIGLVKVESNADNRVSKQF